MQLKTKKELRKDSILIRKNFDSEQKTIYDKLIFNNLINLNSYKSSKVILCYVSTKIEVDTIELINYSLKIGKKVAVPCCFKDNIMEFYFINSLNELKIGAFGILEPTCNKNFLCEDFKKAICIVPGLCFDKKGHRIGYGKGFYDRFLSSNEVIKIGLCFEQTFLNCIPFESNDIKCDVVVTENKIIRV